MPSNKNRLFFVTDIHGSDRCFRKFINAAKFYKAQSLVLGGDITGKVLIPIIDQGNRRAWVADYLGERKEFNKEEKVAEFEKTLADGGIYSIRVSKPEYEEMRSSEDKIHSAFEQSMRNALERWMALASERLKESGAVCYISVGNDDDYVVDEVLVKASGSVVFCEEKIVRLYGHEMLSLGTSNHTPWNSPREADEPVLKKKLEDLADKMERPEDSIFSVHVPPIDSGIDAAPMVDESFKPVMKGGHPVMIPAGSSAVREAIEKYKPILALHGHIHESRGIYKLGRTVCINPGSEYAQGILRGAIVDLEEKKVLDYLLVSG